MEEVEPIPLFYCMVPMIDRVSQKQRSVPVSVRWAGYPQSRLDFAKLDQEFHVILLKWSCFNCLIQMPSHIENIQVFIDLLD